MKNKFSLVSTNMNWSSLSLPSQRMRKANKSCMVSAVHPLVKRGSYRLFRFSSCRYVMKGEIFIGRPPLCKNTPPSPWRYPRGGVHPRGEVWCVQLQDSSVTQCRHSELDMQIVLLLVVKLVSAYILSQLQNNRRDSGCISFLMTTCLLWFVLACMCVLTTSHRTASVTRVSTKLALPRH